MRLVNAWGWKLVVGLVLGVWVRDVDCAFKLHPGSFYREHNLETRGAMINKELSEMLPLVWSDGFPIDECIEVS